MTLYETLSSSFMTRSSTAGHYTDIGLCGPAIAVSAKAKCPEQFLLEDPAGLTEHAAINRFV